MLFNNTVNLYEAQAEVEGNDVDMVVKDPETQEGLESIADEIETNMQQSALESMTYFENGEEVLKEFCASEEAQALLEARKMSKKTFVRLGKNDDLTRRTNMACLILAREKKDPLFNKLALNRVKEKQIRNAIYKKYQNMAKRLAMLSQKKHIQAMKQMPSINFNAFNK